MKDFNEFFRRAIVLPNDESAKNQLEEGVVDEGINVELIKFNSNEKFLKVWDTGVFSFINSKCSRLIDDYEDETLDCSAFDIKGDLSKYIDKYKGDSELLEFFKKFQSLYIKARENKMPLHFIF